MSSCLASYADSACVCSCSAVASAQLWVCVPSQTAADGQIDITSQVLVHFMNYVKWTSSEKCRIRGKEKGKKSKPIHVTGSGDP
jgi:hypothetical protein